MNETNPFVVCLDGKHLGGMGDEGWREGKGHDPLIRGEHRAIRIPLRFER